MGIDEEKKTITVNGKEMTQEEFKEMWNNYTKDQCSHCIMKCNKVNKYE